MEVRRKEGREPCSQHSCTAQHCTRVMRAAVNISYQPASCMLSPHTSSPTHQARPCVYLERGGGELEQGAAAPEASLKCPSSDLPPRFSKPLHQAPPPHDSPDKSTASRARPSTDMVRDILRVGVAAGGGGVKCLCTSSERLFTVTTGTPACLQHARRHTQVCALNVHSTDMIGAGHTLALGMMRAAQGHTRHDGRTRS